jgi:hypothetical protein
MLAMTSYVQWMMSVLAGIRVRLPVCEGSTVIGDMLAVFEYSYSCR